MTTGSLGAVAPVAGLPALASLGIDAGEDARILAKSFELQVHARGIEELFTRLSRAGKIAPLGAPGRARAALVGAGLALEPGDMLFGTTRDWPAALARGMSHEALVRAVFAARPGAGSIVDAELGVVLSDATHGGHVAEAVGFGMAAATRASGALALCCIGSNALLQPETTAALLMAVEKKARVVFLFRGPRATIERLVVVHRIVAPSDSAHRLYWALAEARAARPGLPILIDARHGNDAYEPLDARELQARQLLSPELERVLETEVAVALDRARSKAEGRTTTGVVGSPTSVATPSLEVEGDA